MAHIAKGLFLAIPDANAANHVGVGTRPALFPRNGLGVGFGTLRAVLHVDIRRVPDLVCQPKNIMAPDKPRSLY